MTIQVELDIFSGMPNPSWQLNDEEERDLIERLVADRSLMLPLMADTGGLGYRGFIVRTDTVDASALTRAGLPASFRLGGHYDKAQAAALWMLETGDKRDSGLDAELLDVSEQAIDAASVPEPSPESVQDAGVDGYKQYCTYNYLTSDTNFSFWNASQYITRNNCYNYASNYRTNTFAQPGRQTGSYCTSSTCVNGSTIAYYVRRDGYSDWCLGYPNRNISICLVIWPGRDFHFYRKCCYGHWCHKPGQTAARNTDNSGRWITSVEQCNRGSYTEVTGYFFANGYRVVR